MYLGAASHRTTDGLLGGERARRASRRAIIWTTLRGLDACLGEAASEVEPSWDTAGLGGRSRSSASRPQLRQVLFLEHLWPWLPAYLGAVSDLPGSLASWAEQRTGNRRRALGAMLAAEPERTADWLADEADRWSRRHLAAAPGELGDRIQQWWAGRAAHTARVLRTGHPVITGS